MLEEAIEDPSRPLDVDSGFNRYWATRLGIEFLNKRRQQLARVDTPHRVRLVAQLLDDFASQVAHAAELLTDSELMASADETSEWAAQVRQRQSTIHDIYAELKPLLGDLRRYQVDLSFDRLRDD